MLYRIAHIVRDNFPILWNCVNKMNSFLFVLRYGKRLRNVSAFLLKYAEHYDIYRLADCDKNEIVAFFERQPQEAYSYFHPHGFDMKSIEKLQRNKSFLAYVLRDKQNGHIVGYCFNRAFFHGKGFRGRMVDIGYRGKGLGTLMNKMLDDIGFGLGLRLFETVSKNNIASYKSAVSAGNFVVIKELPNNELFLEILK